VRGLALAAISTALLLAACGKPTVPEQAKQGKGAEAEPETVDIPQTVTEVAPGTTPMRDRVAVVGLLNKRNGISRDLELKPGEAVRAGDVIVRLRACETTAPWEVQQLTGAFVQLDVRNTDGNFQRVFSGWLYRESPSLNVIEHPIYDVWPKSCRMTHPGAVTPSPTPSPANRASSAPKSGPTTAAPPPAPAASPSPEAEEPTAVDSNDT
jgi:hypothetical protein